MTFVNGEIPQASKFNDLVSSEDLDSAILNYLSQFTGYASTASASADIAAQNAQVAQNAAAQAVAGQNNAAISANIYPTVPAAQAAITAGTIPLNALFNVVSPLTANYCDQYKNVAGTATATGKSIISAAGVQAIANMIPVNYSSKWLTTLLDSFSQVGAGLRNDYYWVATGIESQYANIVDVKNNVTLQMFARNGEICCADSTGNVAFRITTSGQVRVGSLYAASITGLQKHGWFRGTTLNDLISFVGSSGMHSAYGNKEGFSPGIKTRRMGTIITADSTKSWMTSQVESPMVWFDDVDLNYHMVFTGYSGTFNSPGNGSICHAVSQDLVNWVVDNAPVLQGTGNSGDPDMSGCTGPYMVKDSSSGTYYLYYIGLPLPGYEGGVTTLCMATSSSIYGPWTRMGTMINVSASAPWRTQNVYHPSIVNRSGIYYCFINGKGASATGGADSQGNERIGYATSTSLSGPWVVDDVNSPLLTTVNNTWENQKVADPSVYRDGNLWFMEYFGYNGTSASDSIAVTTDEMFPLGWRKIGYPTLNPTSTVVNEKVLAHKPFVYLTGGKKYHYFTGVGTSSRVICLNVSGSGIDDHFAPGSDNNAINIITPSLTGGAAAIRWTPEVTTRPVIRTEQSSSGSWSIYREAVNGFTQLTGFRFDGKSVAIGDVSSLTTTATDGFLYIPTIAGTPTGAPTAQSGCVPICFDTTSKKIWVNYSGTWTSTQTS